MLTTRPDGGAQSRLPAPRHMFPRGNCRVGQRQPHFESSQHAPSVVAPIGSGRLPGPGRRVSRSGDRPIATRRFPRGHPCTDRHLACTPDAERRHQGGQAKQDGNGRPVTAGGIQVKAGHVRWGGDHARHATNAVTRRHSSAAPGRNGTGPDRRQAGARIEGRSAPSTANFRRNRAAIDGR